MTTATEFLAAWQRATIARSAQLLPLWHESKLFTNLILNNPECLLADVAKKLDLEAYWSNYYSVDGVLYSEKDLVPGRKANQFWFRSLEVAFEHENHFNSDVYQEISHLLILRARLSVLVTYPKEDKPGLMDYFHSIIAPCDHASDLDRDESFLIIFGWREPLRWEGYVFKKSGWKQLNL